MSKIQKVISLIKKCKDQPILYQKLYSHLGWLLKNEYKTVPTECKDNIALALIYGSLGQKCPNKSFENTLYNYLKNNRNKENITKQKEFVVLIIICYFVNQPVDSINTNILTELIMHHMYINSYTDYLILKLLTNYQLSILYGSKSKKCIQKDLLVNFYNNIQIHKLSATSHAVLLLGMIMYDTVPKNITTNEIGDLLLLKFLESFVLFATYAQNEENVKMLLSTNTQISKCIEGFVQKTYIDNNKLENYETKAMYLTKNYIFDTIRKLFANTTNKEETKTKIIEYCDLFCKTE
ncbi:hypothetical protein BDAP_000094 [Binucleata daphniae]